MTTHKLPVLILHADGTNRDHEAAQAFELAGAAPEIVHLNQLRTGQRHWRDYKLLVIPGGFSYADALGAGRLLAIDLNIYFADEVRTFVDSGNPVIGICNGFQALVKAGILPASSDRDKSLSATLTFNASGHFECRWVTLAAASRACIWTRQITDPIYCPVAHGEGRFILKDPISLAVLRANDQIALAYAQPDGTPAQGIYPENPNGSLADIAGVCNPAGNVLGLMPHPENHLRAYQHPRRARGQAGNTGLALFAQGVQYAEQL
jgi:phosphoribosylformylglycinamidine synthase subunit PurQ / glutaminase